MLHEISWLNYGVGIICLLIIYYAYVGIAFYGAETRSLFYRLTGKNPALQTAGGGDLQIPVYEVMGKARPDEIEIIENDELDFGPSETNEEGTEEGQPHVTVHDTPASRLISSFSEMIAEVKTLIRVINESSESKENFEMLFCLIIQKYAELKGTIYQQQVNDFLLSEGAPEFPFELSEAELGNYWASAA